MIGRKLSHFRILDRIGEGGMGIVYRAEDDRLRRFVALKVLPPERLADEERRRRFVREARTAAAVTHPNIAVVHEIDESDGVVFIAMELIEGRTLRAEIGGRPMAPREALRLAVEIACGLAAAHHARVIHRDLKPDNIMVTHDGQVKILDFGLAKLLEERQSIEPAEASTVATASGEMTQAGRVLGTVAYMSPEQARGVPVDPRSDLFSFGIVLYEMLTGEPPFRGTTPLDVLSAILREQPAPAVGRNPAVPAGLERIIGRCLAKEPGGRYQSTRDLVVDLKRVREETEVADALRASPSAQAAGSRRGRVIRSGAIAIVLLVSAVGAWVALRLHDVRPTAPLPLPGTMPPAAAGERPWPDVASIAVLPFDNLSGDPNNEYFAEGLSEELLNALVRVRGLRVIARTSSFRFKGKNEDIRLIGRKLNVGAILEGSVRESRDRVRVTAQLLNAADGAHLWAETYDREVDDIFAVQREIAQAVVRALKIELLAGEDPGWNTGTRNLEAYNAYLRGHSRALRLSGDYPDELRAAVRELERAVALDPGYALAWVGLASAHHWQGEVLMVGQEEAHREARAALDRAIALNENLPEARALAALLQLLEDWDFPRADADSQRALAMAPGSAEVVWAASEMARALGRFDEALALTGRLMELDPLNVFYRAYHGLALAGAGRWGEAESVLRDAIELEPTHGNPHLFLGMLLIARGRHEEALSEVDHIPGPYLNLAFSAAVGHALGRKAESDASLAQLVEKLPHVAAYQIAGVHAFRGEADLALEWLERARDQHDSGLLWLSVDPLFEKLRRDARYTRFLSRLHLTG